MHHRGPTRASNARPLPDKRPKRTSDSGMIRNEPIAVIDSEFFPNILPIKLFRRKFNLAKSQYGKIWRKNIPYITEISRLNRFESETAHIRYNIEKNG